MLKAVEPLYQLDRTFLGENLKDTTASIEATTYFGLHLTNDHTKAPDLHRGMSRNQCPHTRVLFSFFPAITQTPGILIHSGILIQSGLDSSGGPCILTEC